MSSKKKRVLALGMVLGMLLTNEALAAKVSYIETEEDEAYHLEHLKTHAQTTVYTCTGVPVKVCVAPGSKKIHGRMILGEQFVILDTYKDWVRIQIVSAAPGNPDSRKGMTGWIDPSYADCGCDEEAYYAAKEAQ